MQFPENRAPLFAFIAERLPVDDELSTLNFQLAPAIDEQVYAGVGHVRDDDQPTSIVFTLPDRPGNVFFGITASNEIDVAQFLANLEDYEVENSVHLHSGEVVMLNRHSDDDVQAPTAILLLRTASSVYLRAIGDVSQIKSVTRTFLLAMPITDDDLMIRRDQGHDALMDYFSETGRDVAFYWNSAETRLARMIARRCITTSRESSYADSASVAKNSSEISQLNQRIGLAIEGRRETLLY